MRVKVTIPILLMVLLGCGKDKVGPLSTNLTNCPANSICTYNYFDNADFKDWSGPVPGQYRVFWYKSTNQNVCDLTSELYFKASLNNSDFEINSNQIAGGQILGHNISCPCCDLAILTIPIGGEIKGTKTDATHWLINASVIFGTSVGHPTDALVVNQYFALEKLP